MSQLRLAVVVIVGLLASPGIAQAGGTFRYSLDTDIDYVDPALAYFTHSWEIEYATCSMLLSYPDAPAPRGARLVPDAAAAMPTVSRDGRTYTFRLRQERRFSDGSRVTALSFKHALTRVLHPDMKSPGQAFFKDILGAEEFIDRKVRTVVGMIVLRGNRLRIRLTKPSPDLLPRLAMPFACPVKPATQHGAYAGMITDQYLPLTMRGFRQAAIYPVRPDLARARALATGHTRSGKGVFYACGFGSSCIPVAQIVRANLREIGVDMDIAVCPGLGGCNRRAKARGARFDLSMEAWTGAYFDPQAFMFLFDGRTLRPAENTNVSYFDWSTYNRRFAQASALTGQARYSAFGKLDVDLARDAAPIAAYLNDNARRLFSARVRNFFEHPVYGLDLPAIAVE